MTRSSGRAIPNGRSMQISRPSFTGPTGLRRPSLTPWQAFRADPKPFLARRLYRPDPGTAQAGGSVSIVCISDTHNREPHLPDGDVLLHAGDLTKTGSFAELQAQIDWLDRQPHRHKVIIAGNHDRLLDSPDIGNAHLRDGENIGKTRADLRWGSVAYLENTSITLELHNGHQVKVYGSPLVPECGNFAFQYPPTHDVWKHAVPDDIDVLLTHGPPKLHMDDVAGRHKGCEHLLREIWRLKGNRLKLVVFGHIHEGYGQEVPKFDGRQRYYEAIMLGEGGWFALIMLVLMCLCQKLHALRLRQEQQRVRLVNAAHCIHQRDREGREPVLVYI